MPKRKRFATEAALGYTHTEAYFGHEAEAYVEAGFTRAKVEVDEFSVAANALSASVKSKDTSAGTDVTARAKVASVKENRNKPKRRRIADASAAYVRTEAYDGDNETEVYAETGLGKAKVEAGLFNAGSNLFKLSGEFKDSPTEVRAMTRQEIGGLSAGVGPLTVKVGRNIDTGFKLGNDGAELKILGNGLKVGDDGVEVSLMGNGFTFTKDRKGVEVMGTGVKAGKDGMELKVFGIGFEIKF
ncbi:uncharacterized protein LOC120979653 [Bufo bufo]|uniref:uncharacterized protein LOC120979653 n=1 Tax=Bufo bufo TaxID=8384 RepID=UPI001ABEC009|nr:uncharacterized protein LOC120979653 [Bufo bufo]